MHFLCDHLLKYVVGRVVCRVTGDERLTPLCHDRSLDDRPGNLDGWASMVGLITALSVKDDVLLHA